MLGLGTPPPPDSSEPSQLRKRIAEYGPLTKARLWHGLPLNINYIVLYLFLFASGFIAVVEGLDMLFEAFRRPLVNLIFHIVLFLWAIFFTLLNAALMWRERLLTEKIIPVIVGTNFSMLHLSATISFIVWAVAYDGLNTRVQFSSDPVGFIALGICSGVYFLWYMIGLGIFLLLLVMRRNHAKLVEVMNVLSGNQVSAKMYKAAMEQSRKMGEV